MVSYFFERQPMLDEMQAALGQALGGAGQVILIDGEPGVGKTTLVDCFCRSVAPPWQVLRSCCELLFLPHPFGPFEEILQQYHKGSLARASELAQERSIFQRVISLIQQPETPLILVVEDIHWADERSLDLIRFLVRRLAHSTCLLVLTVRDHDLIANEGLREMSGTLPLNLTTRLQLRPLSPESVEKMSRDFAGNKDDLFRRSGGNPFFVEQLLSAPDGKVPHSIRESVLARMARLSPSQRELCEVACVFPREIDPLWLEQISSELEKKSPIRQAEPQYFTAGDIDLIVQAGIFRWLRTHLEFSHEIVRSALEEALSPLRRRTFHALALAAKLNEPQVPKAHLLHHAEHAGQIDVVLQMALLAATQAQDIGALREAAKFFAIALKYLEHAEPALQARILTGWGSSSSLTGNPSQEAIQALLQALEICQTSSEVLGASAVMRRLSMVYMFRGDIKAATHMARDAAQTIESSFGSGPQHLLGMAWSQCAFCSMVYSDTKATALFAQKAFGVADALSDQVVRAHTLVNFGSALFRAADPRGKSMLTEGLELSLQNGCVESALVAYMNLSEVSISEYALPEARRSIEAGMEFAHETGLLQYYFSGLLFQINALEGQLSDSKVHAHAELDALDSGMSAAAWPLVHAYGLASSRLHAPEATPLLEQTLDLCEGLGLPRFILPSAFSLIENYWLQSKFEEARATLIKAWKSRGLEENKWLLGGLLLWDHRLGNPIGAEVSQIPRAMVAKPFQLELEGKYLQANATWGELGAPFEAALSLIFEGNAESLMEAQRLLVDLGCQGTNAMPDVVSARQEPLRNSQSSAQKRGPYGPNKTNQHGLTTRELHVMQLVVSGSTNADIAQQLHRSERTVEHHVSSILNKTGARNRADLLLASFTTAPSAVERA
jgi:DNA-binding CsgD family transcriptional regulator